MVVAGEFKAWQKRRAISLGKGGLMILLLITLFHHVALIDSKRLKTRVNTRLLDDEASCPLD